MVKKWRDIVARFTDPPEDQDELSNRIRSILCKLEKMPVDRDLPDDQETGNPVRGACSPSEVRRSVIGAFENPRDLRTIAGIARDADLPIETVERFLEDNPSLFEKSGVSVGGRFLYTLKTEEQCCPV